MELIGECQSTPISKHTGTVGVNHNCPIQDVSDSPLRKIHSSSALNSVTMNSNSSELGSLNSMKTFDCLHNSTPFITSSNGSETFTGTVSSSESESSTHEFISREEDSCISNKKSDGIFSSLLNCFEDEMDYGVVEEADEAKRVANRQKVETFFHVPFKLERDDIISRYMKVYLVVLFLGYLQCADVFLYTLTFLPLRFCLAAFKLILSSVMWTRKYILRDGRVTATKLAPAQIIDLIKVFLLIVNLYLLSLVDFSMLYHIVRGQDVMKIYIFFNILEVFDKLFSSFGNDILDSLFWTATEVRQRKREHFGILAQLFFAVVYVPVLHTVLVLLQCTALSVAFNSHSKTLMTILLSNNFVELKSNVFKRFESSNMLQLTCADVRERFHWQILMLVVCLRNFAASGWSFEHLLSLLPDVAFVFTLELIVDWMKHGFTTKFNGLKCDIYQSFLVTIAQDVLTSNNRASRRDPCDVCARRMGFIPIPVAVLVIRVFYVHVFAPLSWSLFLPLLSILFICLILLKLVTKQALHKYANEVLLEDARNIASKRSQSVPHDSTSPYEQNESSASRPLLRMYSSMGILPVVRQIEHLDLRPLEVSAASLPGSGDKINLIGGPRSDTQLYGRTHIGLRKRKPGSLKGSSSSSTSPYSVKFPVKDPMDLTREKKKSQNIIDDNNTNGFDLTTMTM